LGEKHVAQLTKLLSQVWIPINMINFYTMPVHMRTPFMALGAFCYTTFFSVQQAQLKSKGGGKEVLWLNQPKCSHLAPIDFNTMWNLYKRFYLQVE
jgi:hypothetical protein